MTYPYSGLRNFRIYGYNESLRSEERRYSRPNVGDIQSKRTATFSQNMPGLFSVKKLCYCWKDTDTMEGSFFASDNVWLQCF